MTAMNHTPPPEPPDRQHPKPRCKLVGTYGNVFSIIGRVKRRLVDAGQRKAAEEFAKPGAARRFLRPRAAARLRFR